MTACLPVISASVNGETNGSRDDSPAGGCWAAAKAGTNSRIAGIHNGFTGFDPSNGSRTVS